MECLDRVGMADLAAANRSIIRWSTTKSIFSKSSCQDAKYILDEPFSGVDAVTERAIIDVLKSLKI